MEPGEAKVRSAEIISDGGNPVVWFETRNVKPNTFICVVDGKGFEGPWIEIVGAGFLEKPGVVVLCNPITKAQLDAAIKKSQRKFKPGEAVPGLSRNKEAVLDAMAAKAQRDTLNTVDLNPRKVGMRPELGMPYDGSDGGSQ